MKQLNYIKEFLLQPVQQLIMLLHENLIIYVTLCFGINNFLYSYSTTLDFNNIKHDSSTYLVMT